MNKSSKLYTKIHTVVINTIGGTQRWLKQNQDDQLKRIKLKGEQIDAVNIRTERFGGEVQITKTLCADDDTSICCITQWQKRNVAGVAEYEWTIYLHMLLKTEIQANWLKKKFQTSWSAALTFRETRSGIDVKVTLSTISMNVINNLILLLLLLPP